MAPNGDYVVIWHDDQDQDGFYDLLCRGFYANGAQKFSDRLINQASNTGALNPVVAMADDGSFVVAWEDDADHNGFYQIKARGFTASGGSRISEFTVNSAGPGQQLQPAIGMAPDGAFVIAWTDDQDHNFYSEVFARGFNANGSERFSDITVNGVGTASQYRPSVGLAADGGFVVAWIDQAYAVKSRPFDPNGTPLADEMILNNDSLQMTNRPTIDVTPDGDYVVVWEHLRDDGRYSLRGRRMDAAGGQAREFEISTLGAGDQTLPTVAVR